MDKSTEDPDENLVSQTSDNAQWSFQSGDNWEIDSDTRKEVSSGAHTDLVIKSDRTSIHIQKYIASEEFLSTVKLDEHGIIGGGNPRLTFPFESDKYTSIGKLDDKELFIRKEPFENAETKTKFFSVFQKVDEDNIAYQLHIFSIEDVPNEIIVGITIDSEIDAEFFNQQLHEAEQIILSLREVE